MKLSSQSFPALNYKVQILWIFAAIMAWPLACMNPTDEASESLVDQVQLLLKAEELLEEHPNTVTASRCDRSAGDIHCFYSEGDYWWPDPDDRDGPYIRKDGMTNPENFVDHRKAMRAFSTAVAKLTAAYKMSDDERYAAHATKHLKAWFVDTATLMRPHLLYSQAIKGRDTGRYIGVIDGIHLIEVSRSIQVLIEKGFLREPLLNDIKSWFNQYLQWLTTHQFGIDERDHGNNHSTWWAAQVATYANLLDQANVLAECRFQFKKLLSSQMAADGGFPDELERTKPYNYSLFNIEGYAVTAYFASTDNDNLWLYQSENGSLQNAIDFMVPYIRNKDTWPYQKDIAHFDELPIQSIALKLAAKAYQNPPYLKLWKSLPAERKSEEVDRNYPIRESSLWD